MQNFWKPKLLNEKFQIEYYNGSYYDEESKIENILKNDEKIHSSIEGRNFVLILKFLENEFILTNFIIKGGVKTNINKS